MPNSALVILVVFSSVDDHVHFVDGADGGITSPTSLNKWALGYTLTLGRKFNEIFFDFC